MVSDGKLWLTMVNYGSLW